MRLLINLIVEGAKSHSGGIVEQHIVGAKLARRFQDRAIENFPAHAADQQTDRSGDFMIAHMVYHVTSAPSRNVIQKCAGNLKVGKHPILLVPKSEEERAQILAQEDNIDKEISIIAIEDFIAVNIIELATENGRDFFSILKEIVDIYNQRLADVETDLSLHIEVS